MNYTEDLDGFINRLIEKTKEKKIKWEMIPNYAYRFRAIINEKDGKRDQIIICPSSNSICGSENDQEVIKDIEIIITIGFDEEEGFGEIEFEFSTQHHPYLKYREALLSLYSELEIHFDFELEACNSEAEVKRVLCLI